MCVVSPLLTAQHIFQVCFAELGVNHYMQYVIAQALGYV